MTTTEVRTWLLLAAVLLVVGALVCLALALRSRRRRGLSGWPPRARELTTWGSAEPERVKEAARLIKRGERAESPEVADLVCRLARRELLHLLLPWYHAFWTLMVAGQIVNMAQVMFVLARGPGLALALSGLAALLVGFLVVSPLYWSRARKRSERALELNETLACRAPDPPAEDPDGWEHLRKPY